MEVLRRYRSCLSAALTMCFLFLLNSSFCWSLNHEGAALLKFKEKVASDPYGALSNWRDEKGVESPCSWLGVGCSEGYVVVLNLKDLCLSGTLSPDIGHLVHVKSIILRNNSFSGVIPKEIVDLKYLEVLDLGYDNISGQLLSRFRCDILTGNLLLDNNRLLDRKQNENYEPEKPFEVQPDGGLPGGMKTSSCNALLISWNSRQTANGKWRKLLQEFPNRRSAWLFLPFPLPPPPPPEFVIIGAPPPPPIFPLPPPSPIPTLNPPASPPAPLSSPRAHVSPPSIDGVADRPGAPSRTSREYRLKLLIVTSAIGMALLLALLVAGILFCYCGKTAAVKPTTGLSGQLQKAFLTGVPRLERSELEAACEDFSNVIGSSSVRTLYKGTLSSGVEIAVASMAVASAKEWTSSSEAQFRNKIDTLSNVNHKNFVNLLGYCAEDEPLTRMLVFEYASNGTLFEHLHIRETEHIDWSSRLRIAMGIAYCLEHMHQLTPALAHWNLTSSAVYLTEDYAAKLSDFIYHGEESAIDIEPNTQNNVFSFGVLLFEIMTGRPPSSEGGDSFQNQASDYLGVQKLREIVDPTLNTYDEDQLQQIEDVIKRCINPDPRGRPTMKDVCAMLREATTIGPDGAVPKLSPLWWAELEVLSTEAN